MNNKTVSEFMQLHRYSYDGSEHQCGCGKTFDSRKEQLNHFTQELKEL